MSFASHLLQSCHGHHVLCQAKPGTLDKQTVTLMLLTGGADPLIALIKGDKHHITCTHARAACALDPDSRKGRAMAGIDDAPVLPCFFLFAAITDCSVHVSGVRI
uniref:Uncharacterized protein n=1 Tax=Arundo donax TaxID=35708 RepID=A0A0A9HEC1_ARUDO